MDATKSVTAVFARNTPALTVGKTGTGGGTVSSPPAGIDCGATCSASYDAGASVTLTAAADGNSTFVGWSGACSGSWIVLRDDGRGQERDCDLHAQDHHPHR